MAPAQREKHNIDKMKLWGTGADFGEPVFAGIDVSQESALRLAVVWRCIRVISETIASMPVDVVRKRGDVREPVDRPPAWLDMPNPESNGYEFRERIMESLLMDGNAFILTTARDSSGFAQELWTLNPRRVQVRRRDGDGRIYFLVDGSTQYSRYGSDNPLGEVLHIKLATGGGLRGMSPIEAARQSIGLGLATEKFGAKFFGRGQTLSGVIQLPATEGPAKSREYIEIMREQWEADHAGTANAHRPGILTGGATWQGISISNDDAQFLETRRFQVEDIATRIYGVPPHLVGLTEKQTSWGTGLAEQVIGFQKFTLMPHIVRLETALSSLTARGQFLKLNQRELLRSDSKSETELLTRQLLNGVISRNEFRALLDLPPAPGGDRYMIPLNQQILLGNGSTEPAPAPAPSGNGQMPSEVTQP
jgi:HK97 family phage portal protein